MTDPAALAAAPDPARLGRLRRLLQHPKRVVLLGTVLFSAIMLLATTNEWFSLSVLSSTDQGLQPVHLSVTGSTAASGLVSLALVQLVLTALLASGGRVYRILLPLLQIVIGLTIILSSGVALYHPVGVSERAITAATGVSGSRSTADYVSAVTVTAWPWVALLLGALTIALAVFALATLRRWPQPSRRYTAVRFAQAETSSQSGNSGAPEGSPTEPIERNAVSDWDTLSSGSDPTSR